MSHLSSTSFLYRIALFIKVSNATSQEVERRRMSQRYSTMGLFDIHSYRLLTVVMGNPPIDIFTRQKLSEMRQQRTYAFATEHGLQSVPYP
jgi:hypothetical protein